MPNYSYVVSTATYDPFTFQELLTPYVMYKEAYDQSEAAYNDLSTKAGQYKYLGEQLEGQDSKAAQIYKGYADELDKQAKDLAKHGLSMNNRRALTSLKRRYAGEIGRLDLANTALEKERELRRTMNAKDSSMLYASDNLSIDDFLDNGTPNLYNISGTELYARGAAAGKAASSRVYQAGDNGSTLGGYYKDWVEKYGYDKASMDAFRNNVASIPELQQAVDDILAERGVIGNLSGVNLARARQSVVNGIIDGAVYQEKHNPVKDDSKLSASQSASLAMERERLNLSAASSGMRKVNGQWVYDPNIGIPQKSKVTPATKGGSSASSRASYTLRNKAATIIGAETGQRYNVDDDNTQYMRALSSQEYSKLIDANGNVTNEYIRNAIGNGNLSDYEIYITPKGSGSGWFGGGAEEDSYLLIPRNTLRDTTGQESSTGAAGAGTNDIPQ